MIFTKDKEVVEKFLHYNGTRKICFVPRSINNWEDSDTIWSIDSISGNEFYVDVNSSVTMGKNSLLFDILKMLEGKKCIDVKEHQDEIYNNNSMPKQ